VNPTEKERNKREVGAHWMLSLREAEAEMVNREGSGPRVDERKDGFLTLPLKKGGENPGRERPSMKKGASHRTTQRWRAARRKAFRNAPTHVRIMFWGKKEHGE